MVTGPSGCAAALANVDERDDWRVHFSDTMRGGQYVNNWRMAELVWPPGVQGILVTEGVRGEGGVLTNSESRRFMFDAIPEPYKNQTADGEGEGWRYTQGDRPARRPPELPWAQVTPSPSSMDSSPKSTV